MSDPKFTIRLAGANNGAVFKQAIYVQSYKPASMDQHGMYRKDGHLTVTSDRSKAIFFHDAIEAHQFYTQSNGYRPDGQANRPLASYDVEITADESPLLPTEQEA